MNTYNDFTCGHTGKRVVWGKYGHKTCPICGDGKFIRRYVICGKCGKNETVLNGKTYNLCSKCRVKESTKYVYTFECGHRSSKYFPVSGNKSCHRCVDQKTVVAREKICSKCGELFPVEVSGQCPKICPDCKVGHADECGSQFGPKRHYDCEHYSPCLDIGGKLFNNPKACIGCPDYIRKKPEDVANYMFCRETFQEMHIGRVA